MATRSTTGKTTTKATTPRRSSTKAAVKKPVAAAKPRTTKPAAKKVVEEAKFTAAGELGKKELLEKIVAESGLKKGDARQAMNAMLSVMRDALREGKDISAAPLGKLRIARKKSTPNGELAVLRVKLKSDKPG